MYVSIEQPTKSERDKQINYSMYNTKEFFEKILENWYIKKIKKLTETGYIKITVSSLNYEGSLWLNLFVFTEIEYEAKLLNKLVETISKAIKRKEQSVVIYVEDKIYNVKLFDPK